MTRRTFPLILLLLGLGLAVPVASGVAGISIRSTGAPPSLADPEVSALHSRLQAMLNALHEAGSFPGSTLGFVLPDGRSGSVSVGLADVEANRLLKPTDRMLAGSIGKTYVSAVRLKLVHDER